VTEKLFVLSGDGHAAPRTPEYRPYFDPEHLDAFDGFLEIHRYRWTPGTEQSFVNPNIRDLWKGHASYENGGFEGVWDAKRRLEELDNDGVAVEIIFPDDTSGNSQPFCGGIEPPALEHWWPGELKQAGARAHNRWLAEFCDADPRRLRGLIALGSLHDIDTAVGEVRRAWESGLRTGVILPLDYYLPLYHHDRYEPLWKTCLELGLPIVIHGADGGPEWYGDGLRAGVAIFMTEVEFWSHRPLWCLIFGGVLDRYPDLKLIFTEQGSDWVAPTLANMDMLSTNKVFFRFAEEEPLALLPSQYWERQCYLAPSLIRTHDDYDRINVPNVLFGSDYPHIEGIWPELRATTRELMRGRDPETIRSFLGGIGASAYSIEPGDFELLTQKIGPDLSEFAS
jgi:predicted TIM-barrel fold metal-dependent hydrolase